MSKKLYHMVNSLCKRLTKKWPEFEYLFLLYMVSLPILVTSENTTSVYWKFFYYIYYYFIFYIIIRQQNELNKIMSLGTILLRRVFFKYPELRLFLFLSDVYCLVHWLLYMNIFLQYTSNVNFLLITRIKVFVSLFLNDMFPDVGKMELQENPNLLTKCVLWNVFASWIFISWIHFFP
jgi:hypothetical protein